MKTPNWMLRSFLLMSVIAVGCGSPEDLDPGVLGIDGPYPRSRAAEGSRNFAQLINQFQEAKPKQSPWAGYWWPFTAQGIASSRGGGSPAGKYDAARGRTTQAQSWEIKFHGSKVRGVESWWGHCNGWCVSAALYPEPNKSVRVNGITFSIADIKALLAEVGSFANADFFGERVENWDSYSRTPTKYEDTVPNQFFLVLTNYMGRMGKAVLIDRYTGGQVWNQPLVGYRFKYPKPEDYLGPSPDAPSIHRMNLEGEIWWADDAVPADTLTPPFEWRQNTWFTKRTLKMELWLDGPVTFGADGKITGSGDLVVTRRGEFIVGGKWAHSALVSQGHPDYMWVPYAVVKPPMEQDFANPHVDHVWIERHILSGGVDDPSVNPAPVEPAPDPDPSPSPFPTDLPDDDPFPTPTPSPTRTTQPTPTPTRTVRPTPTPTRTDGPLPTPTATETGRN